MRRERDTERIIALENSQELKKLNRKMALRRTNKLEEKLVVQDVETNEMDPNPGNQQLG
jgi:hypothetical protein